MRRFILLLGFLLLIVGIAIVITQWSIAGVLITAFGAAVSLAQIFIPMPVLSGVQIQLRPDYCARHPEQGEEDSTPFLTDYLVNGWILEYRVEVINKGKDPIDITDVRFWVNKTSPGRLGDQPEEHGLFQGPTFPYRLEGSSKQMWVLNYIVLAANMGTSPSQQRITVEVSLGNGSTMKISDRETDKFLFEWLHQTGSLPRALEALWGQASH